MGDQYAGIQGKTKSLLEWFDREQQFEYTGLWGTAPSDIMVCKQFKQIRGQDQNGVEGEREVVRKFGIKDAVDNANAIRIMKERLLLSTFRSCEHIVRLVTTGGLFLDRSFLVMELSLSNDSISEWIGLPLFDPHLWSIFLCCKLWKANDSHAWPLLCFAIF